MKRARSEDALAQSDPSMQHTFNPSICGIFSSAYDKQEQGANLQQPRFPADAQIAAVPSGASSEQLGSFEAFSMGYPPSRMTPFNMTGQLQPLHLPQQQQGYTSSSMLMPPGSLSHSSSSSLRPLSNQLETLQQQQQRGQFNSGFTSSGLQSSGPGSLSSQLRAPQQQQQQQPGLSVRLPQDLRPLHELQQLLPRLNQEYKHEMQLLLQACQIASRVQKQNNPAAAAPNGNVLLLDPAARGQLQQQVLGNCNEKHRAVTAAFRLAAQAIAAAVSSMVSNSRPNAKAAAAAAVDLLSGAAAGSSNISSLAAAAAGSRDDLESDQAGEAVTEALQQLRSSYHQELVAATSALFAICRGFGQSTAIAAAASQPIKQALAAAQQQHNRVEQLWQDVLVTAAGGGQ